MIPKEYQKSNLAFELKEQKKRLEDSNRQAITFHFAGILRC